MRTIILILIFFPLNILAHQDKVVTIHKSNVFLQYQTGWEEQEIGKINEILAHLTDKLVKGKQYHNDILISFTHDYTQSDTNYYALSYGDFSIIDYGNNRKTLSGNGLKLIIQERWLDIEKVLSIIDNAISNIRLIKREQAQLIVDLHMNINGKKQFDTLTSIPWKHINDFSETTSKEVKQLISQRTYRNLADRESFWNIDYYYQNNQFHFYNSSEPMTEYNPKTGNNDTIKVFGEDILVVDRILEIFGNWNYGHFVFVNDSTFYYIRKLKDNVLGPHKVDSIRAGRPPVRRFEINGDPMFRYTLYFDRYIDFSKALFIPDSNVLISNFDNNEDYFINSLFVTKNPNKTSSKEKKSNQKLVIFIIIGISIFINLYLFRIILKRKKGKAT